MMRERLKEQLGNPTSNNVLSESVCENILARLDREMGLLNAQTVSNNTTVAEPSINDLGSKECIYNTMVRANKATA